MGVHYFLPLVTRTRYYGRRKAKVDMPLFPGYVFLHGALDSAYEIDRSRRPANFLTVADQEQIEWELANIRLALENQGALDAYLYLASGSRSVPAPFGGYRALSKSARSSTGSSCRSICSAGRPPSSLMARCWSRWTDPDQRRLPQGRLVPPGFGSVTPGRCRRTGIVLLTLIREPVVCGAYAGRRALGKAGGAECGLASW